MTNVCRFAEALSDSVQFSKRHLLLGNGFSIACCPSIFHYGSLFAKAALLSETLRPAEQRDEAAWLTYTFGLHHENAEWIISLLVQG